MKTFTGFFFVCVCVCGVCVCVCVCLLEAPGRTVECKSVLTISDSNLYYKVLFISS